MLRRKLFGSLVSAALIAFALLTASARAATQAPPAPQGLGPSPTFSGPTVSVPDQVNLRSGPDVTYELIGVMVKGQTAPATGRSAGGEWIQIRYVGAPSGVAWVYSPLVVLNVGSETLPIIEPPPTSTPLATATIDPTLAARFTQVPAGPTRLPTFTAAPPVVPPTLIPGTDVEAPGGFPPALLIIGLFIIGVFGMVVSFLRRR